MSLNTALKIETASKMAQKLSELHNHCLNARGEKKEEEQKKKTSRHIKERKQEWCNTQFIILCQCPARSLYLSAVFSHWISLVFLNLPSFFLS